MSETQDSSSVFKVTAGMASHAMTFDLKRFDYQTDAEQGGQLVCCSSGELELFGDAGEWTIPANHMVFIPGDRMFRLRARRPSSGVVAKFCRREVAWEHDGCWVGPVSRFAAQMIRYSTKWAEYTADRNRLARACFTTLGEMLPGWFRNERIMWTPCSNNSIIQKGISYVRSQGTSVSLAQVAAHVGVSERTFRRHLQNELGHGWREFIREMRMNRAMDLLRRESKSITETAFEVGFSSSSAFSVAFQEYIGRTPSAYARSLRQSGTPDTN